VRPAQQRSYERAEWRRYEDAMRQCGDEEHEGYGKHPDDCEDCAALEPVPPLPTDGAWWDGP